MLLVLIFLICAATLVVLLWVGTLFFQGYIYTEPTRNIAWQAPVAGVALALFFTLWCMIVVNSAEPGTQEIAYDTLFRFSPTVEKYKNPVKELWVERNKQVQKYEFEKLDRTRGRYKVEGGQAGFPRGKVDAIIIKDQGGESRFEPITTPAGSDYREFRDADGWSMRVTDDPTGMPTAFRWGRFFANLLL